MLTRRMFVGGAVAGMAAAGCGTLPAVAFGLAPAPVLQLLPVAGDAVAAPLVQRLAYALATQLSLPASVVPHADLAVRGDRLHIHLLRVGPYGPAAAAGVSVEAVFEWHAASGERAYLHAFVQEPRRPDEPTLQHACAGSLAAGLLVTLEPWLQQHVSRESEAA